MKLDAAKLCAARARAGITLRSLSERSGVSVRTLQRCEEGAPAAAATIRRLAIALHLQPDDLRADAPAPPSESKRRKGLTYDEAFAEILAGRVTTGDAFASAIFPCEP